MIYLKKFNEDSHWIFGFGKKKEPENNGPIDIYYRMFLATKIYRFIKNRIVYAVTVDNKVLFDIGEFIKYNFDFLYKLTVGGTNRLYNKGVLYVEVYKEKARDKRFFYNDGDFVIFRFFIDEKGKECVGLKINKIFIKEFIDKYLDDDKAKVPESIPTHPKPELKKVNIDEIKEVLLRLKNKRLKK